MKTYPTLFYGRFVEQSGPEVVLNSFQWSGISVWGSHMLSAWFGWCPMFVSGKLVYTCYVSWFWIGERWDISTICILGDTLSGWVTQGPQGGCSWVCCENCCAMLGNAQLCSLSNLSVWSMDTHCVDTQSSLSIFIMLGTAVWSSLHSGAVVPLWNFYLHQTPSWLWLVWTNSPVFTHQGMEELSSWYK